MPQLAPLEDWLAPAVVTGVLGIFIGAFITHWLGARRDRLNADKAVLDTAVEYADAFFDDLGVIESTSIRSAAPPPVSEVLERGRSAGLDPSGQASVAATILSAWENLKRSSSEVRKLSEFRYDGLRVFARRMYEAELASDLAATLRAVAARRAVTSVETLEDSLPFSELVTDALLFQTLAVVYRRKGPLRPWNRLWWRTTRQRNADDQALVAVLRRRRDKEKSGDDEAVGKAEIEAIIDAMPEFDSLTPQQRNELIYKLRNNWI